MIKISTSPLKGYISGIDGLRAIAVLAVIIYHMELFPWFKGGFIGVDIFFVISGYVISKSIFNRSATNLKTYLSEFYQRRIKRIIPALILCLTITILASTLFIPDAWLSNTLNKTGLSAFFGYSNFSLVHNNFSYFSPRVDYNPFLHTWSLAIEEQFYLLFPLLFYIWLQFKERKSFLGFTANTVLIFTGILSLCFAIYESNNHQVLAFYLLPARFWELAAGAILYQLHSKNRFIYRSKTIAGICFTTGLVLISIGFVFADQNAFPFPWAIVPVAATMLMITSIVSQNDSSFLGNKFLGASIMSYLGKISYSLYLWHWPVAVLLRWTVGFHTPVLKFIYLVITFLMAAFSYHLIEKPIRTSSFLKKQKNWKIISAGILVLISAFSVSLIITNNNDTISLSVTKNRYIWHSGNYYQDRVEEPIVKHPAINGRRIFGLGDSHTAAYRTMLHIVSGQLDIEVFEYEQGDGAIAGLLKPTLTIDECKTFYEKSYQDIKQKAQPGDILFLASLRMPELSYRFERVDIDKQLQDFFSSKAEQYRLEALAEADSIITEFENLGLIVLISAPEPVLKIPPYRCSDWFNKMNPIALPGPTVDRNLLQKIRQPIMDSLNTLQQRHPDMRIWDPFMVLCTDEEFSAYDENGLPIFYDGDHLSGYGNRLLAPSFKDALMAIWIDDYTKSK